MMSTQPTAPRRRRWPWFVLIAAVLVVAAVVGLGLFYGAQNDPDPIATPRPSTPSTPATTAPPAAAGVDGCLAGTARAPQTVLDAQKAAPRSVDGAVSFVLTFERWAAQKPTAPASEIAQLDGVVWTAGDLAADVGSYEEFQAAQFNTTTMNGYYRVESFDEEVSQVELTVMLPLVINNAIDPTLRLTPSVIVEWTDRGWVIVGEGTATDKDSLPTTGVPIPGGC